MEVTVLTLREDAEGLHEAAKQNGREFLRDLAKLEAVAKPEKSKQDPRIFTDAYLRNLKPRAVPYKRSEKAPKGEGRLIVKVLPNGTKECYFRYRPDGEDKTVVLGRYDALGRSGLTLAALRVKALEKRALQRSTGDVKEHEKAVERKKQVEARKGSLHQLLDAYVQSLRDADKVSAAGVNYVLQLHVVKAFPEIVAKRANEVEGGDIQLILGKMVRKHITRGVNMCRAYLHAAFQFGAKADHDPRTVAKEGVLFGLKYNPVSLVPVIREYDQPTDEREVLTEADLWAYWHALDALPVVQRAILRFNLAIGQQRPKQLLRADWPHFDFDANTVLLKDSKGRKGRAAMRDHLVPLTGLALRELKPLRELNDKRGLQLTANDGSSLANTPFSADGKRRLCLDTLSHAVSEISTKLKREKGIEPFDQRDLRRAVETQLQKLGIDKEVRAHLLSHGRSQGIQSKHYERYDFLDEKRLALRKWTAHLQRIIEGGRAAKVTPLRKSA
jgi:integrase